MPFIATADMKTAEPLPGWRGRFWRSEQMSFAHYSFTAGASIHEHHHPNEEMWTVVAGELEVTIGGDTQVAGPGAAAIVPGDVPHSVRALTDGVAIAANHPIRREI